MIVDASVWVAVFRDNDVHHGDSIAFLDLAVADQDDLHIPNLALAEISGVFSRQTGKARLATRTVNAILALPRLQRHELSEGLADRAVALAARCTLRGADAVYVALAEALNEPLVTWDNEILDRSTGLTRTVTPSDWLRHH